MSKIYKLLKNDQIILSKSPGKYAGHKGYKIFGTLDCKSGMRMKKENRVFFLNLEDAIIAGYRPCKLCRPIDEYDFQLIKKLTPYKNVEEFYNSGIKFN
jgi:methylphosphotriester-DNA--protein-cysteine methyltransferase